MGIVNAIYFFSRKPETHQLGSDSEDPLWLCKLMRLWRVVTSGRCKKIRKTSRFLECCRKNKDYARLYVTYVNDKYSLTRLVGATDCNRGNNFRTQCTGKIIFMFTNHRNTYLDIWSCKSKVISSYFVQARHLPRTYTVSLNHVQFYFISNSKVLAKLQ